MWEAGDKLAKEAGGAKEAGRKLQSPAALAGVLPQAGASSAGSGGSETEAAAGLPSRGAGERGREDEEKSWADRVAGQVKRAWAMTAAAKERKVDAADGVDGSASKERKDDAAGGVGESAR